MRNELDGWDNSSKFSAWLNSGCFSVRRLVDLLNEFELRCERNESTYWLYIELLWREYFQWLALKIGKKLFKNGNSAIRFLAALMRARFRHGVAERLNTRWLTPA